eukprot:s2761_g1.t1
MPPGGVAAGSVGDQVLTPSPRKRQLRPQRVQAAPPGGLLGHGLAARQGLHLHVALFDLGDAELLSESFSPGLTATGLMWTCEDSTSPMLRGHKARWERYVLEEGFDEPTLLAQHFIIPKTGGPPADLLCLPSSVTYHNSSATNIQPWLCDTEIPNSISGTPTIATLQLKHFALPDWRKTCLQVRQADGDLLQLSKRSARSLPRQSLFVSQKPFALQI